MSIPRHKPHFQPRDADWEDKVRTSFGRQGAMGLIGAELVDLAPGWCEIHMPFKPELSQQHGFFHGGITTTIVDSAAGYAGFTLMPPGTSVLTVEFKVNMLAPADGEEMIAIGRVIKPGRNLVICQGDAWVMKNGHAHHCALMQQTLMTMHSRPEMTDMA